MSGDYLYPGIQDKLDYIFHELSKFRCTKTLPSSLNRLKVASLMSSWMMPAFGFSLLCNIFFYEYVVCFPEDVYLPLLVLAKTAFTSLFTGHTLAS